MKNYYGFLNLINDKESFEHFNSLSSEELISFLNDCFDYIDDNISNYANIFKIIFKNYDYDELYYSCKSLSEEINNIKIIINILKERDV